MGKNKDIREAPELAAFAFPGIDRHRGRPGPRGATEPSERKPFMMFIPRRAGVRRVRCRALRPPGVGAITFALLFGFCSLIYGVSRISLGVQLHQLDRSVQPPSLLPKAA